MRFTKMQGAGNDYIYVDCFAQPAPENPRQLAIKMSDRHFGVGGDGLILICPSDNVEVEADAEMRMFNADGSPSEMCGNGVRCVAKYLYDHGVVRSESIRVASAGSIYTLELLVENGEVARVRVDMGEPVLHPARIPTTLPGAEIVDAPMEIDGRTFNVTCVSMGNPHCVVFVDDIDDALVGGVGPRIETDPRFPERTNVEFVKIIDRRGVRQRTWERGSGETLACGTGASAVCVAGVLTGQTERNIRVQLLGGELDIEWDQKSNHVFKTGPAEEVFSGDWPAASRL